MKGTVDQYYFIGIGGAGMSALALYCKNAGKKVAGYDRQESTVTQGMVEKGIPIHYQDDVDNIPENMANLVNKENTWVVYTPAVPANHKELTYFTNAGYKIVKRAELLGIFAADKPTIAISGTHGKTTITAMVAHIFKTAGLDFVAFLGGISVNYGTNLVISGRGNTVLVEADEYDRSFLQLYPQLALVTSIDPDHLDVYGEHRDMVSSFNQFLSQVSIDGQVLVNSTISQNLDIPNTCQAATYSIEEKAHYSAENIRIENEQYVFDIHLPKEKVEGVRTGLPGRHNVENAIAAAGIASLMGVDARTIKTSLESFKGVKRRFEYQHRSKNIVYIDDYAHHPAELDACISSARELFPGKKITGVFQPHLYSRTRDLCEGFAASLSLLDKLILLDIYPAREKPIPGVDAAIILDKVKIKDKQLIGKAQLLEALNSEDEGVLLTMGAGDIDAMVEPIKNMLDQRVLGAA